MPRHNWGRLSPLQIGRYAEYYVKMRFVQFGFDVYSAEVDDRGIDFVLRLEPDRYWDVQVKSIYKSSYIYFPKAKTRIRPGLLIALAVLREESEPDLFLVSATQWLQPDDGLSSVFVVRDYEGLKSRPEYGINLSAKGIKALDRFQFDAACDAIVRTNLSPSLVDHCRAMARNNAWSNARLHRACVELTAEAFAATRVSFFPSLRQTLNHILAVDRNYLADLMGSGRVLVDDQLLYSDAAALAAAQGEVDRQLLAFCDSLDAAALERVVAIDRKDGVNYRETVYAILAHLFVHQIHHRGQVHAMLAGTPVPPPQLDEFFLASDAPRRADELQRLGLST